MADDFSKEVRDAWKQAEQFDKDNRDEALRDLKFARGEHWDDQVKAYRERLGRELYGFPLPCLTVNNVPAVAAQVTGDRRANEVAIKVLPNEAGDVETADVRSELIRNIEVRSRAQRIYLSSFTSAVYCGMSNFRVDLDYAYDDVFERDIFIRDIPNPLAVLWDPESADATGRDAQYCFVAENMPKDKFQQKFGKNAKDAGSILDAVGLTAEGWTQGDTVRIAEYWTMFEKKRTIAMLLDPNGGDPEIIDVTDLPEKKWKPRLIINPVSGKPMIREAPKKYARMVVTNGQDQLTDAFEICVPRLPIIKVTGQEIWEGDKRTRFGLIRFMRDPAQLKDYMRSVIAEKLMLSPRANFMADASAIKGREKDWPNTLVHNQGTQAPQQVTGLDLNAIASEAQWYAEDIRDVTGIFEANRGMPSNETSGIAIQRRQQEGDIATIVYHDNMDAAQMECGDVINYLLPVAYDTARTIRLIGANEAIKFMRVNDPLDEGSVDLSKGRYDVTISTGPAYMTRRLEASAALTELAGQAPQLMQIAGDKIIQALDIPDGDEIAARIKRTIPPQILGDDADESEPGSASPGQNGPQSSGADPNAQQGGAPPNPANDAAAQAAQQMAAAAQEKMMMDQAQAAQQLRLTSAKADEAQARAIEAHAKAAMALGGGDPLEVQRVQAELFNANTNRLKALTPHIMAATQPKEQDIAA